MVACEGRMVVALTREGLANQKPWNSFTPRSDIIWNCSAVSTFSATSVALAYWLANFTSGPANSGLKVCKSSLMKEARGIQLA